MSIKKLNIMCTQFNQVLATFFNNFSFKITLLCDNTQNYIRNVKIVCSIKSKQGVTIGTCKKLTC